VVSSPTTLTVNPAPLCTPPPLGLVSWWRAENNAGDAAGTNSGTFVNGATFAAGLVGNGFAFNGSNYVQVADSPSLDPVKGLTIEGWIFPFGGGNGSAIASKDDGFSSRQYLLNLPTSVNGQAVLR